MLTVSTPADVVNGDVSSPDALRADPGPDGIALREAIEAADNSSGSDPIPIPFLGSLRGSRSFFREVTG